MSITELLVVALVALLVIKPEDIPSLRKNFLDIRRYFKRIGHDVIQALDEPDDAAEMNLYIEKITAIGEKYDGEYSLESVKNRYLALLKEKK